MSLNKIKSFSLLVLMVACLFMPVYAFSAPFLTCDPQAEVNWYTVSVNGVIQVVEAAANTALMFNLSGLGVGAYHFEVQAMIVGPTKWGVSEATPFDGTCVPLVPVSGLSVVNQ